MKYLRMMFYDYGADYADRVGDFLSKPFFNLSQRWAAKWIEERRRMLGK